MQLREITTKMRNGFVGKATDHYSEDDDSIAYVQGYNVKTNKILYRGMKRISAMFHAANPNSQLKTDDVLTTQTGEIGTSVLVPSDLDGANCHALIISRFKGDQASPRFYSQLFNSPIGMRALHKISSGAILKHINVGEMLLFKVPVPSIEEQETIANYLATWDRAIELTEKLIAEKRLRRKGLMQQLLTGKRRLPGAEGKWREVRLGNIFHNRTESARPDLPLVSIAGDRGVIPRDEIDRKDSSNEDKSKYLRICPGDIGYNTMRMWQGVSGLSAIEGIVSPAYTVLTPKQGIDAEFMAILFKFQPVVHLFYRHSQGMVSDTWNLKFRHFAKIKVTIPNEDEQKAIAKIFRTLNRELELLQAKVDALRQQKKGLMQQLLTGKMRVKV